MVMAQELQDQEVLAAVEMEAQVLEDQHQQELLIQVVVEVVVKQVVQEL